MSKKGVNPKSKLTVEFPPLLKIQCATYYIIIDGPPFGQFVKMLL